MNVAESNNDIDLPLYLGVDLGSPSQCPEIGKSSIALSFVLFEPYSVTSFMSAWKDSG